MLNAEAHRPGRPSLQTGDDPQERGLAAARCTKQYGDAALVEVMIHLQPEVTEG